jgi:aminoglycoside phosphotransferase (APT) family kinase protein
LNRIAEGASYFVDESGNYWRSYQFIDGATSHDRVDNNNHAFEAGRAFGHFQRLLADFPAPRLHDTIPEFHHGPMRLAALKKAIATDPVGRVRAAKPEIDFVFKRLALIRSLIDAKLPERITHNDCKLNNVLFDEKTGAGLCVIDLDTVMPGLLPFDFGDMVRTVPCTSDEDEQNLSKVKLNFKTFSALSRGYLSAVSGFITDEEKKMLVTGGMLITFLIGIRFLTDHLGGDHYFKIHRANHNLDRCRVQFKLLESIEEQRPRMEELIASIE